MKSYEDIAERVFEKGDEILKARQKRAALIKKTSFILSEICAVVLICFSVWKIGDMEITPDCNFPDKIITESESTADFSAPVSTSENNKDDVDTPETDTVSETDMNPTIFQTGSSPADTILNTPVSNKIDTEISISAAENRPDQTEQIQTPLQTAVSAAETKPQQTIQIQTTFQTGLKTTEIPIQTTVCTTVQIEDEGSYYMKKLAAFCTSAIVIASQANPIIGNAEYKLDESRLYPGEKAIFAQMDSGELDTDINGDGAVDVMDGYTLYRYALYRQLDEKFAWLYPEDTQKEQLAFVDYIYKINVDAAVKERIEAIADYNGDGIVDMNDAEKLVRYLITRKKVTREHLEIDYYDPEYFNTDSVYYYIKKETNDQYNPAYKYVKVLDDHLDYLRAKYDIIAEMCETDNEEWAIDFDFNGNGQLDVGDIYVFIVYHSIEWKENNQGYISEEEWDRCEKAFLRFPCDSTLLSRTFHYHVEGDDLITYWEPKKPGSNDQVESFIQYLSYYIVSHTELKSEYFTEEYYAETYGDNYYSAVKWRPCYAIVEQAAERMGIKPDSDAWIKYNTDDLNELFISYCRDVENGVRPAPDVNMDGEVDLYDYFTVNTYLEELIASKTAETSVLPVEIWNNIETNFDINGNGTTKDIYDILMVQMYVTKYEKKIDNFDEIYADYKANLGLTSTVEVEGVGYENNVKILADIESKTISGDANCDGKVEIADATLILQYLTNKDEYQLKAQGMINADCCNTGDGVTAQDALAIQMLDAGVIEALPTTIK